MEKKDVELLNKNEARVHEEEMGTGYFTAVIN